MFRIENNAQFNSIEVYFDNKPDEAVREALKSLKMRWHNTKKCWYGYATAEQIKKATEGTEETTSGKCVEGYLGATKWEGSKSKIRLYGADLSKAIRHDLKGLDCTVKVDTFSGGQEISVTVKPHEGDYVEFDEFAKNNKLFSSLYAWEFDGGKSISSKEFCEMSEEGRAIATDKINHYRYEKYLNSTHDINHYHYKENPLYTDQLKARLSKIVKIVLSYNYDDSNGMVDYFNTNFYYTIRMKAYK